MPSNAALLPSLKTRVALPLLLGALALIVLALPARSLATSSLASAQRTSLPKPAVLTFTTMQVGAPGNPSVGIVPFEDKVFSSCAESPQPENPKKPCMEVGGVDHQYGI